MIGNEADGHKQRQSGQINFDEDVVKPKTDSVQAIKTVTHHTEQADETSQSIDVVSQEVLVNPILGVPQDNPTVPYEIESTDSDPEVDIVKNGVSVSTAVIEASATVLQDSPEVHIQESTVSLSPENAQESIESTPAPQSNETVSKDVTEAIPNADKISQSTAIVSQEFSIDSTSDHSQDTPTIPYEIESTIFNTEEDVIQNDSSVPPAVIEASTTVLQHPPELLTQDPLVSSSPENAPEPTPAAEVDVHGNILEEVPERMRQLYSTTVPKSRPALNDQRPSQAFLDAHMLAEDLFPAGFRKPRGIKIKQGGTKPHIFLSVKTFPADERFRQEFMTLKFRGLRMVWHEFDREGIYVGFEDWVSTQHAFSGCASMTFNGYSLAGAFLYSGYEKPKAPSKKKPANLRDMLKAQTKPQRSNAEVARRSQSTAKRTNKGLGLTGL